MNKSDLKFEYMRGTGPGGPHKNKTCSACRVAKQAAGKKARRDEAIHNTPIVRTYHYGRNQAKDHRSGKTASLSAVLGKGRIDLLR